MPGCISRINVSRVRIEYGTCRDDAVCDDSNIGRSDKLIVRMLPDDVGRPDNTLSVRRNTGFLDNGSCSVEMTGPRGNVKRKQYACKRDEGATVRSIMACSVSVNGGTMLILCRESFTM